MFSTILKEITGFFDRYFLLAALFPVLGIVGVNLLLTIWFMGIDSTTAWWTVQSANMQTGLIILFLAGVVVIAYLAYMFQTTLTRLYEGYWSNTPLLKRVKDRRVKHYEAKWQADFDKISQLAEQITVLENPRIPSEKAIQSQKIARLYAQLGQIEKRWNFDFPAKKIWVMPTQLGNIMRSAEVYPLLHYNIDAVIIWSRLYHLLPATFTPKLQNAKANLDLFLLILTLLIPTTFIWQITLILNFTNIIMLGLVSSGWVLIFLCYKGALQATRLYGELIKTTFDLYRWELIKALHLPLPKSNKEEKELWDEITKFIYRRYPLTIDYKVKPEGKKKE